MTSESTSTSDKPAGPLSLKTLSQQIHDIARFIYDRGNKGTHEYELRKAGLELECLDYDALYEEILIHAEGRRRSDYHGWYARKNPHWAMTWLKRFATVNPDTARALIDIEHETALGEDKALEEKRQRVRLARHEEFALGVFADFTDLQLQYFCDALQLLAARYIRPSIHIPRARGKKAARKEMMGIEPLLEALVTREAKLIGRELWFRQQPDMTKISLGDTGYLWPKTSFGTFTREYARQVVEQAAEPKLEVDLTDLPQKALSEKPIATMNQWELLESFLQWAGLEDESDPFKADDIQAILRTLRGMYARAKGEHHAAGEPLITGDDNEES